MKLPSRFLNKISINSLLLLLFCVAGFALILAYISQFIFDYQPCILCVYQRWPFFAIIAVSGIALGFFKLKKLKNSLFFFCVFLLFCNAALAFYHSGVEKKIFKGPANCSVLSLEKIEDLEELRTAILNTKAVRCDEPNFKFLHLSMANWNLIYCLVCAAFALFLYKKRISFN